MSLRKLSDSDVESLVELWKNERALWNNGRIQNRLARFLLLFTLHAANAIVAAEAAADTTAIRPRQTFLT